MSTTAGDPCTTCGTTHPVFAPCPEWKLKEMAEQRRFAKMTPAPTLVEKIGDAILLSLRDDPATYVEMRQLIGRAALAVVMAEMREPSEGMIAQGMAATYDSSHPVLPAWRAMLSAFEKESA